MDATMGGMAGALAAVAFFAFLSFGAWIDYRKKKDEGVAGHQERMKALELGHPPLNAAIEKVKAYASPAGAEIERAKAYAIAARSAGNIGVFVPLAVMGLTVAGTIVAILCLQGENLTVPLIVAWSIAAVLVLVTVVRSLGVIRQLPRPMGDARAPSSEKQRDDAPAGIRSQPLEL